MPDYFTKILDDFDAIVFFDTETSGLEPLEHQIIELAAIRVVRTETGALRIEDKMDDFIRLPEGEQLRPEIRHYKLESKVQNSHRAIDDVCALLEVTKAMDEERDDLSTYINVFGYNPKYGISGEKIAGITYHAQDFTKFKRPERLTLPALAK